MAVKLEGSKKLYHPKDSDPVECETHRVKTTLGALDQMQRLAVEAGIDTSDDLPCILLSRDICP